jgi:hypothetical protein
MTKFNLFIFLVLVCACNNSQKSENADYKIFEDKETGWTTKFPGSFKVMTDDEIAKLEGRGETVMEETLNQDIILSHRNLLWISKDPFNSFTSNTQPYDSVTEGSYKENQEILFEAMTETYTNQGMQIDVKYGTTKIDNLEFATMETTIYTPDRKKTIMTQVMYDRLLDGTLSLTLNINYNNDKDKAVLLGIIDASKLSRRN